MVDFNKKTREEKLSSKISAIHSVGAVERVKRSKFDIEIVKQSIIEGGVEVFVKAWHEDGSPVGFGVDGSVEIERFRIFNPPVLVPDPEGDIVRKSEIEIINEKGEEETKTFESRYRNDPKEALMQIISHSLAVKKQIHKNSTIIKDKVGNTTDTFYPAAGANSPCDGVLRLIGSGITWSETHDADSGDFTPVTQTLISPASRNVGGGTYVFYRGVVKFNTATISTDAITSAVLSLNGNSNSDGDADGDDWMTIVQATTLYDDNLDVSDYPNCGSSKTNPTEGIDSGGRMPLTSFTEDTYLNFSLNSTGIGWINKTGITTFGVREGHDVLNHEITITANNSGSFWSADDSGTTRDPKLVVEHSAGAVGPTNLKSYSGNLKANIASISGNLIANIKTLAGNS